MSEDAHKTTEGAVLIKRIGRNVLNVGIFLVEVLFLILAGPALLKFFMPVVLGWLIACIANPLVKFLEKRLHIVSEAQFLCGDLRCDPADCAGMLLWDHCVIL